MTDDAYCTREAQAGRTLFAVALGAALGFWIGKTIAPTHPALAMVGGASGGLLYAAADTATSCPLGASR